MSFNADIAIQHMEDLRARGITYSMTGSRTGTDGTADCSGAVYGALVAAGVPKTSWGGVPNTDSMHPWLQSNGFQRISENAEWEAQKGDVIIWGREGASGGAAGHTGIMMDHDNFINCSWRSDAVNGIMIDNYDSYWAACGSPYFYVYRYVGGDQNIQASKPLPVRSGITWQGGSYTFAYPTNARTAPSLSASVVATYDAGETLNYDGTIDAEGYTWMTYVGQSGLRRYAAMTGSGPEAPSDQQSSGVANSGSWTFSANTNIRTAPSTSAAVVGLYDAGQTVNYDQTTQADGYTWISWIGASGYRRWSAAI